MDISLLLARLIPRGITKKFRQLIKYSTLKIAPEKLLGLLLFYSLLLGVFLGSVLSFILKILPFWLGFLLTVLLIWIIAYVWILLSIDSKSKFVENVLPDALQLMSSNIRAGLTTDRALLLSARSEFGPLADEIKRIGRETMTGRSLAAALRRSTENIKSDTFSKTIDLIVISIKSGGKLADLLDQISNDLREQQMIQKEISASVLMYVLFIFIAIAFGAPLLFAMSSFLVGLLRRNITLISGQMPELEEMGKMPISLGGMQIPEFITIFGNQIPFLAFYSVIALTCTSFFGSLIIGLILRGDEKAGVKFLPILLAFSIGLFLLGSFVLRITLGEMMEF
jgi:pilus assembly protein TadC